MKKNFVAILCFFVINKICLSQITITEFKKIEPVAQIVETPKYDSLSEMDFRNKDKIKYKGLKLFITKNSNKSINYGCIYTNKPSLIKPSYPLLMPFASNYRTLDEASHRYRKFDFVLSFKYKSQFIDSGFKKYGGDLHKYSANNIVNFNDKKNDEKIIGWDGDRFSLNYFSSNECRNIIDEESVGLYTNTDSIGDRYYTILDFISKDSLIKISKSKAEIFGITNSNTFEEVNTYFAIPRVNKDDESNESSEDKSIVILENSDKDTLFISHDMFCINFISVPFFMKLKNLLNGKTIVSFERNKNGYINTYYDLITKKEILLSHGDKWMSTITVLQKEKDSNYGIDDYYICLILKKDSLTIGLNVDAAEFKYLLSSQVSQIEYKGEKLSKIQDIVNANSFVFEDHYLKAKLVYENMRVALKKEAVLVKNRQDQLFEKNKKEEELKYSIQLLKKREFEKSCIIKYGEEIGKLIINGDVKIGMTSEMCKKSWGEPFSKNKTILKERVFENWNYGWSKSLHFENGILIRIEE